MQLSRQDNYCLSNRLICLLFIFAKLYFDLSLLSFYFTFDSNLVLQVGVVTCLPPTHIEKAIMT